MRNTYVTRWTRGDRDGTELRRLDPSGGGLPDACRMAAKCWLAGRIKECIEVHAGTTEGYDKLRSHSMKCAVQKR